jgi:hypothetical protein
LGILKKELTHGHSLHVRFGLPLTLDICEF